MNTPRTSIRPREDSDLPVLALGLIEVHALDGYPVEGVADPIGWLRSDALIGAWVAVVNDEVVGHVSLSEPGKGDDAANIFAKMSDTQLDAIAVLGRLFVVNAGRGLRLGRQLTDEATKYAHSIGKRAVLDVMTKDRSAIKTYQGLGWSSLGKIEHNYGNNSEPAEAFLSPE